MSRATLIACLLALCVSCKPSSDSTDEGPPRDEFTGPPTLLNVRDTSSVEIRMSRGMCFGTCPVYSLVVRGSGAMAFFGQGHVAHIDSVGSEVSRAQIIALLRAFEQARFLKIPDRYDSEKCFDATDHPSVGIGIEFDGRSHGVGHYHGCARAPAALYTLEETIDSIVNTQQWIGDPDSHLSFTIDYTTKQKNAAAVVRIRQGWHLVERATGKPVYHRFVANTYRTREGQTVPIVPNAGPRIAAFARAPHGTVAPLLTRDARQGVPIAAATQGAGTVITADAHILTDLAVVAGWQLPAPTWDSVARSGVITNSAGTPQMDANGAPMTVQAPLEWDVNTGALGVGPVVAKHDSLIVEFPRASRTARARLHRAHPRAGVALIKVDLPQTVPISIPTDAILRDSADVFVLLPTDADTTADGSFAEGIVSSELLVRTGASATVFREYDLAPKTLTPPPHAGGAPIFDYYGRFVAMVVVRASGRSDSFTLRAVPMRSVIELVKQ